MYNQFISSRDFTKNFKLAIFFYFSNAFLVIEYVSFKTALLGNSYSFEILKFSTISDSIPLFMAQLKSEKADLTKETGFSYQKPDIYRKTENFTGI